jgi:flagellar biosynthesis chaperone FliJ
MDKMKSGFSEAGSKAKVMVEVNKLRLQNSSKQKEIEHHYQEIGRIVFMTAVNRISGDTNNDYQSIIEQILQLENEIEQNRDQIKLLTSEKDV